MALKFAEGLYTGGVQCDALNVVESAESNPGYGHHFRAQKPYRNGVTLYRDNGWAGNGFGNWTEIVAVRDGEVVGVYESSVFPSHQTAVVIGHVGEIYSDMDPRRRYVTKTAYHKWLAMVKAL